MNQLHSKLEVNRANVYAFIYNFSVLFPLLAPTFFAGFIPAMENV